MSISKKILIIGPAHPYRGGIAAFNERLARQLQEEGHEVEICNFTLQYPDFLFPGKTQYAESAAPENLIINRKINSVNPLNWFSVGKKIKKQKPDIVLFRYWLPFMAPCFGTIARIIKSNRHTRIVTLADNILPHEKRLGDALLTRYMLSASDAFVVMSGQVLADLRKFSQKPALVVPHPIYDLYGEIIPKKQAREKLNIPEKEKVILFFGFIRKYKGLALLLEAMNAEQVKSRNVKLLIAGEYYGDEDYYKNLIAQLGIEKSLILATHFIPDNEVKNYFCAADVVVQPYISATQSGISQIAYHFEKPMIVTNVGGLPEIVPDGKAGYVAEVSSQKVADAIVRFYDEDKEAEFTENVRREKQRFGWDKMAEAVLTA
ncbi:MAG: glycosyltransferase [Prevotellaceae bacterium]|jgi:glycosyltransferase involved in cell wall biosynthesis|nr:glycosyltransferase [Prevotellaceae bacterium]